MIIISKEEREDKYVKILKKEDNKKFLKSKNNAKGITLIALVITIIVLLILAGVSIAMLTGENGILTKASNAQTETKEKGALEKVKIVVVGSYGQDGKIDLTQLQSELNKVEGIDTSTIKTSLPMTVKVDETKIFIDINGRTKIENSSSGGGNLPTTVETQPYLPDDTFTFLEGTIDTGLVIKDSVGNNYVWVEVPKSTMSAVTSDTDYVAIEKAIKDYTIDYTNETRVDEVNGTISIKEDEWDSNTGITQIQYNEIKNKTLKSIYNQGGFWIARYEAGIDEDSPRTSHTEINNDSPKAISQEGKYPYSYVTLTDAQKLSMNNSKTSYSSSLLFDFQWNSVCKFIEEKGNIEGTKEQKLEKIKEESTDFGNYYWSNFTIQKGKYKIQFKKEWNETTIPYLKIKTESILYTTGSTDRNKILNIYDIAGNITEYILSKVTIVRDSGAKEEVYTTRGGTGQYIYAGTKYPGVGCYTCYPTSITSSLNIGFRYALYKE